MKSVESTHTSATVRCHDCFAALAAPPPRAHLLEPRHAGQQGHAALRTQCREGCESHGRAVPAARPRRACGVSNGVQWCPMVSNGGLVDAPSKHAHTPIRRETRKQYIHSVMDKQNRTHP
eukprot:SAG25_NODE_97_length_15788_cov_5.361910_7_plen_120_part_00